jgi:iron complex outermembrane recepter protein
MIPRGFYFLILLLATISLSPIIAQTSYTGNPFFANDTTLLPSVDLGEVVVQSARERRTLQELPVSTSLIPQVTIEQQQIEGLSDLTSRVPNLYMPSYGSKLTSPIYVRGIGSRINSPSVGLYIDHVPQFDKSSFDIEFVDIERIEVLRGPQGSMHGRNTMGGLIHVFTISPENAPAITASFTAGNYGLRNSGLQLNQAVGDRTAIQLGARLHKRDGYFNNDFTGEKADALEVTNARFRLLHKWESPLKSDFNISFEESKQGGYPYGKVDPVTGKRQNVNYNEPSGYDRTLLTAGLVNSYRMGNWIFRAASSAQYIDDLQTIDQDLSTGPLHYLVFQDQKQSNFSQEITATFDSERINITTGLFGFLLELDKDVDVYIGENKNTVSRKGYIHNNIGAASFTQATFKELPIRGLSLTSGIRVDWERAKQDYKFTRESNGTITPVDDTEETMSFSEILPRLALDYKISRVLNAYISLTKGYKTGGFNSTFERAEDKTFNAEHSFSYETGIKSKWLFNRIRLSASAFYMDWANQQVYQPVPSGQGSMLKNAGKSVSKGLEGELTVKPLSHLEFYVSYGNTHATFTKYMKNDSTDLTGKYLPYVPKYTVHNGMNVNIPFRNTLLKKIHFNINQQWIGKLYWDDENKYYQPTYDIVNAKLTFMLPKTEISIWSKNILDRNYNIFEFSALGSRFAQAGAPAHFGINVKVTY